MARLTEDGQWIILMALIVCASLFFLAYLINESVLVGKTTAESALEFPKSDIQDIRSEINRWNETGRSPDMKLDIESLSLYRENAVVIVTPSATSIAIHFNNGVLQYDETIPL